jgi:PAS domain S-box-containing protein
MSSTDHLSELEALRSQVADLSRELAEREQLMSAERYHLEEMKQDFREQTQLLRAIIEGPAAETGEEFFAALVTHLTSALHVQYAVIGEVSEGLPKKMRTLAVSAGGTLVGNFEYELAHTPCATALTETFVCFDRDVQGAFPLFQRLADLGAESYCAVPLRAKGGTVMGLLLVMDTRPLQQVDDLQSLLGVLAPRIVAEFERRRAEREHAQALADLFNVTETVPDILFTLDTQGNMVKWNRRVVDVTGYSPEELLNKPALAFVPPEEQTRTAAAIQRAFTEGYAELEGLLLTKDLRIIPYHWTGALLKNAHGEPIGITGVGRDVSGKKLVEEELKQQQRHLVDAQGLAHLGSWNWEVDTGEVKWSDELFRIFGYEPGAIAITYDRFMTSLHPDDQARVLATIDDVHRGTCPYDIEYRIVRPDGEVRFIYARADVHRDATGHPLSMAGTVLDITERKQAEEKLRLSEQRQELALSGANLGLWDWDVPSGTALFDVRWCSMIGYAVDELNPHVDTWRSLLHQEDAPIIQAILESHLKNETPDYEAEFRIRHKGGHWIWILARGRVVERDHAGAPLRMAGTHMDITDRKRAEEALIHNERQLRTVLDALPVGVWFTDQSGKPVLFNPAAKQIWSDIKQVGGRRSDHRMHSIAGP